MKFFKNKKNKLISLSVLSTISLTSIASVAIYLAASKPVNAIDYQTNAKASQNFIAKDNLELDKTLNSLIDLNLKEIPKPTPQPKPKPEPKKEIKIIKITAEDKPKPKPEPKAEVKPVPKPKIEPIQQPKQELNNLISDEDREVAYEDNLANLTLVGVDVHAKIENAKTRQIFKYDVKHSITNPNPYQNDTTGKIISVDVTDKLRKAAVENAKGGPVGLNGDMIKILIDSYLHIKELNGTKIDNFVKQNSHYWDKEFWKWQRLFDSENVKKFLNEEGLAQYDTFDFGGSKAYRYLWLYNHIDFSKVTKLSKVAEDYLAKGYVLDQRETYFTENGELESSAYNLPDDYNGTISRLKRDNLTRRVFSYDSPYNRSPDQIRDGSYPGWTSSDVTLTDNEFKDLVQTGDGVKIILMTRDKFIENDPKQINQGYVLEIDAANKLGYDKTIKLIQRVKQNNLNVISYRIKNMGENDTAQAFKPILRELPDKILQLELHFSDRATNTGSLIELENKSIKELALYTRGNSLLDEWSINPLALRKTEWINTNDYNVSSEYAAGAVIFTRITFNTLAFDVQDYDKNSTNPFERINLGLRMAYYARNNEPFFQGAYGSGLDADHNEGGNSYPTGLDFSRVPEIKSLRGLIFNDIIKSSNNSRKIWRATFYNNDRFFEIDNLNLEQAGFENFAQAFATERPKIKFSNGPTTVGFKIKEDLSSTAIANLIRFKELVKNDNKDFLGKILVDVDTPNKDSVVQKLQNAGFTVEQDNGFSFQ
ncbi:putative immunoglobulin-blocking virulence protein [Mycoplasmopsis phocirhinis]|uniref:Putative immunoglobulin-blocking virulence protein n=1 Tax=Mycoplasmopsis phocirhinis TaxID=142650 RepID=A0A4P6MSE2_9BACT|nr:putative immunoglobulin-blocking virulence protein [Mycoplasmopsis phocirhinis]QBF34594.1 putative immunoglobulin-blocking virulence protein [Mycoplasmopsis phocirhinis]